jgi:putative phosphonate metabolism protein
MLQRMRAMNARYAIYLAPPSDTLLWRAGCRWLSRDPERDVPLDRPQVPGYSLQRLQLLTRSPALYGLHATLKAPFRLAEGRTPDSLREALGRFAAQRRPFTMPPLEVSELSGFLALCAVERCEALHALADDCVITFDRFRRPPDAEELARRRATRLSPLQDALLQEYGYPYVLEAYRFHITLTERLDAADAKKLQPWLSDFLSDALREPQVVDTICLFVQESPSAAFRLTDRFFSSSV